MPITGKTLARLTAIPNLLVSQNVPLRRHTRLGIGGPAALLAETGDEGAFVAALGAARESGASWVVIGWGTNLVVSDEGFDGVVLRYASSRIQSAGDKVTAEAGAQLPELVEFTIDRGLKGLETMAGIPGSVGAAVYGNAGAYGRSISETIRAVRFCDSRGIRELDNRQCEFRYRESVFKKNKDWIILSAELVLEAGEAAGLRGTADDILNVRNRKYPPEMRCAGSVFKNLLMDELPPAIAGQVPASVVREGKAPAAYFLEQAGAKGMRRGDIRVADYHANLIYNAGSGSAAEIRTLIGELKSRVRDRFGLELEEEVQSIGFSEDSGEEKARC